LPGQQRAPDLGEDGDLGRRGADSRAANRRGHIDAIKLDAFSDKRGCHARRGLREPRAVLVRYAGL